MPLTLSGSETESMSSSKEEGNYDLQLLVQKIEWSKNEQSEAGNSDLMKKCHKWLLKRSEPLTK